MGSNSEESNEAVDLGWIAIPTAKLTSLSTILEDKLPLWIKENTKAHGSPDSDPVPVSSGIACAALSG